MMTRIVDARSYFVDKYITTLGKETISIAKTPTAFKLEETQRGFK